MKKSDIALVVVAALFAAIALAGVVIGRDWKLLLVPLALLPAIRFAAFGVPAQLMTMFRVSPDFVGKLMPKSISRDKCIDTVAKGFATVVIIVATTFPIVLSEKFTTGVCHWSAGAIAAACSAISTIPLFSGCLRPRAPFVFCMLGASLLYVAIAFARMEDSFPPGLVSLIVVSGFVVVQTFLAVRDRRRGAAA